MSALSRQVFQIIFAMTLAVAAAGIAAADDFPGGKPDRGTINTQQKADSLFEKGDFERAYFIYREELVPLGDKFAQYMVGYMNVAGKGTEQDYIGGSAWYRLAAERGDVHYSKARDELLGHFKEEQLRLSDARYAELRTLYSDAMIICRLIEDDLDIASRRLTGAKMPFAPDVAALKNAELARQADESVERILIRLNYLRSVLGSDSPVNDDELIRIEQIERRVAELGL